jgi:hypothetical protein
MFNFSRSGALGSRFVFVGDFVKEIHWGSFSASSHMGRQAFRAVLHLPSSAP